MVDILLITGPMNATQMGVPDDASYKVVQVHPTGKDIGSTAYYQAMTTWLKGQSLRSRLEKEVDDKIDRVGVAWFSAGHGAVKAILAGETAPQDVDAWMCLDGLYGSNNFAIRLVNAANAGATSIIATASTSTPGSYDHSLDRWRDVVSKTGLPEVGSHAATVWDLPKPDECWATALCLVAGYENLNHHQQVPAVRKAMLNWWNVRLMREIVVPGPFPGDEAPEGEGAPWWVILGAIGVGGLLGYGFGRLVNPKVKR